MSKDEREERDKRLARMMAEGSREILDSPNGRALMWSILELCLEAEGDEGLGRRAVARDLLRTFRLASWEGLQIMREEWERRSPPRVTAAQPEADE